MLFLRKIYQNPALPPFPSPRARAFSKKDYGEFEKDYGEFEKDYGEFQQEYGEFQQEYGEFQQEYGKFPRNRIFLKKAYEKGSLDGLPVSTK